MRAADSVWAAQGPRVTVGVFVHMATASGYFSLCEFSHRFKK